MIVNTKNNKQVLIRKLTPDDFENLSNYLNDLNFDTKKRYGPHNYDKESIENIYQDSNYIGYIACDIDSDTVVAYSIIKIGYLEYDAPRLREYGLVLDNTVDSTFAPSVSDLWQGCGIGTKMFNFISNDLKTKNVNRIILWGGVQKSNEKALIYYKKLGFITLGTFEYNGQNFDMYCNI